MVKRTDHRVECQVRGCSARANNLALYTFEAHGVRDEVLVNAPLCKVHIVDDEIAFGLIAAAVSIMIDRGFQVKPEHVAEVQYRHLDGASPMTSGTPR